MKKFFIVAILSLFFVCSYSQERLSYDRVIKVDTTLTKLDIYNGLKEWFGMNFVSDKRVLEIDDKDAGLIIGNAATEYDKGGLIYLCYGGALKYTIKVQIRDGRFRVEVTNFTHSVSPGNNEGCALGLITTADSGKKGAQKSYSDKVWRDITLKAKVISERLFAEFEQIKFGSAVDRSDDEW